MLTTQTSEKKLKKYEKSLKVIFKNERQLMKQFKEHKKMQENPFEYMFGTKNNSK